MTVFNKLWNVITLLGSQKSRLYGQVTFYPKKHLNKINNVKYSNTSSLNSGEIITKTLKSKLPLAKKIEVVDISGGCGQMYEIFVESIEFRGLSTVKQHRLINEILKDYIKEMHGLTIQTKVPAEEG